MTATEDPTLDHDRPRAVDVALSAEVAAFLFHEARLLDDLELDRWLALFAPAAAYTLPMGPKGTGTHLHVALVCDDRSHLEDRVLRITSGESFSQNPPSRTVHTIGNVTVVADHGDEVEVGSNQVVVELRNGVQRTFAAECQHRLRRNGDSFEIVSKTVYLLNRDEPLGDLTFML